DTFVINNIFQNQSITGTGAAIGPSGFGEFKFINGSGGAFAFLWENGGIERMRLTDVGLYLGSSVLSTEEGATAQLQIRPGLSAVNGAPLKLTAGINTSIAEVGAIEYDGNSLYMTNSSSTRGRVFVARSII